MASTLLLLLVFSLSLATCLPAPSFFAILIALLPIFLVTVGFCVIFNSFPLILPLLLFVPFAPFISAALVCGARGVIILVVAVGLAPGASHALFRVRVSTGIVAGREIPMADRGCF